MAWVTGRTLKRLNAAEARLPEIDHVRDALMLSRQRLQQVSTECGETRAAHEAVQAAYRELGEKHADLQLRYRELRKKLDALERAQQIFQLDVGVGLASRGLKLEERPAQRAAFVIKAGK